MKGAESTLPVGSNERKLVQHGSMSSLCVSIFVSVFISISVSISISISISVSIVPGFTTAHVFMCFLHLVPTFSPNYIKAESN